jgi:hypothetical protein
MAAAGVLVFASLDRPPLRLSLSHIHVLRDTPTSCWRPFPSGAGSAITAAKNKKGPPSGDPLLFLVEAAGVEPASASTLPLALHA